MPHFTTEPKMPHFTRDYPPILATTRIIKKGTKMVEFIFTAQIVSSILSQVGEILLDFQGTNAPNSANSTSVSLLKPFNINYSYSTSSPHHSKLGLNK